MIGWLYRHWKRSRLSNKYWWAMWKIGYFDTTSKLRKEESDDYSKKMKERYK